MRYVGACNTYAKKYTEVLVAEKGNLEDPVLEGRIIQK
jgi:hypothetical protein